MPVRSLEDIHRELLAARELASNLEAEMHAVGAAAHLAFVSKKDPHHHGIITVGGDRRITFPAVGLGFACCIQGNNVKVGLQGDTMAGIDWQGRSFAIDGEAEVVMFSSSIYCTFAAFSSKDRAENWLMEAKLPLSA